MRTRRWLAPGILAALLATGPGCPEGGEEGDDLPAAAPDGPAPDAPAPPDPGDPGTADLPPPDAAVPDDGSAAGTRRLQPSTALIDFGMNAVEVPAHRSLTVTSVGTLPVRVTGWRMEGPDAGMFWVPPDPPLASELALGVSVTLAPAESATFPVAFVFRGEQQAALATLVLITDGDPAEVAVQLAGLGEVGLDCRPVFVPARVTFGQVAVGTPQDLPLVLHNQGNGECDVFQLKLQACAVSGDSGIATCDEPMKGPSSASFTLVDPPPSTIVLQGQQSWPMTVRFDPAGAGPVAALVGVTIRDPLTKKTVRLPEPGPDGAWSPNVTGEGTLPNPP